MPSAPDSGAGIQRRVTSKWWSPRTSLIRQLVRSAFGRHSAYETRLIVIVLSCQGGSLHDEPGHRPGTIRKSDAEAERRDIRGCGAADLRHQFGGFVSFRLAGSRGYGRLGPSVAVVAICLGFSK